MNFYRAAKPLERRRVVVTATGMISSLGVGMEECYQSMLKNAKNFQSNEEQKWPHYIDSKYGARLPYEVYCDDFISKYSKKMHVSHQTIPNALLNKTLRSANLLDEEDVVTCNKERIGLSFTSIVDANETIFYHESMRVNQNLSTLAFWISGAIALDYGINGYPGLNDTMSGASAILVGDAYRLIQLGYQDVMVVGSLDQNTGSYFHEMLDKQGYLNKYTKSNAKEVIKPYDVEAVGTVPGDGGGCLILESEEHAKSRGAQILYEVVGYKQAIGSLHVFMPKPDTLQKCMVEVMGELGWGVEDLDLVNGNGTGYKNEDDIEVTALKRVLGSSKEDFAQGKVAPDDKLSLSQAKGVVINSLKGNLGHLGAAAGVGELAMTIKGVQEGKIFGTGNLMKPMDKELNFALDGTTRDAQVDKFLKLSYGPGMNCAALAFQKYKE